MHPTMNIESIEALRGMYAAATGRSVAKELRLIDPHSRAFIGLSPFVVVSSSSAAGAMDASPRGGEPGFVKVLDEHTLLIPDAPGNNRLDTLENVVETRRVGLLFLIPGVDETLRINGSAQLSLDERHLALCTNERRRPKLVIVVSVAQLYLHCAKALMRSKLWSADSQVERSCLPTMGQMLADQTGSVAPQETQAQMIDRYTRDL